MTRPLTLPALLLSLALLAGCDSNEKQAEIYYNRAMATMAAGDLDKAALDFRNALKLNETYTEAQLGLARLEEQRRNFDVAAGLYTAIAQRDPDDLESRVKLAQLLLASQETDTAKTFAEQAYRLKPADPRVLVIKAGLALSRGRQTEAVRFASEALRSDPANVPAIMVLVAERVSAADQQGALALIDQGLAKTKSDAGLELLKLRTLQSMGDDQKVEQQFARLVELFPANQDIQDAQVRWYLGKGRNAEAEHAMRRYAGANHTDEAAQIRLAMLINRTGGAAAAVAELKEAIARFPAGDEAKRVALKSAEAQLEFGAGQPEAALKTLEDLVATSTEAANHALAQVRLAQVLARMQKWQRAAELSEAVLAADPRNVEALTVRAMARMQAGNNAGAVEDLNLALGSAPASADVTLLLAEAYERTGSAVLAEEQYTKALALSGYSPASGIKLAQFLIRYGRSDRAMRLLEDLRLRQTADRASLSLLAQMKLEARDWEGAQAIAELLRANDTDGTDQTADQILASALTGMNRPQEGIDILLARLQQAQDQNAIEDELVRAYLRTGKFDEAQALLRGRLKEEPASARLQVLLGSVMVAKGRLKEAEAAFTAAVANGQGDAALAQLYLRTGRAVEAEQAARAGLERQPDNAPLRFLLAEALERRENFAGAIAEYETLLRADPASTIAANNLASLLSEHSDDPKSLQRAFDIAIRFQNSDVPQFLDTLGWIHYLRGEPQAALPLVKRAAEKMPDFGPVQFHLGMVLKALGQSRLSAAALRKSVELAPAPDTPYVRLAAAALDEIKPAPSAN